MNRGNYDDPQQRGSQYHPYYPHPMRGYPNTAMPYRGPQQMHNLSGSRGLGPSGYYQDQQHFQQM